jgi:uncharacterized protein with PQ loop repeat
MEPHTKYQFIGIIAGTFTILAYSYLVHRVYLTKQTAHHSYIWIFLVLSAQILLMIYGILNHSYGIYLPPIIVISEMLYILYVKVVYSYDNSIELELKKKHILRGSDPRTPP